MRGISRSILVCLLALSPAVWTTLSPSASTDKSSKQLFYSQLLFPNLHGPAAAMALSPSALSGASTLSSNKYNYLSQTQNQQGSYPYYTTLWSSTGSQQHPQQRKLEHQNSVISPLSPFGLQSSLYQVPFFQQQHFFQFPQYQQQHQQHQQPAHQFPSFGGGNLVQIPHQQQHHHQQHHQHQQQFPGMFPGVGQQNHFGILGQKNHPRVEYKEGDADTEVIDIILEPDTQDNSVPVIHNDQSHIHHQQQQQHGHQQQQWEHNQIHNHVQQQPMPVLEQQKQKPHQDVYDDTRDTVMVDTSKQGQGSKVVQEDPLATNKIPVAADNFLDDFQRISQNNDYWSQGQNVQEVSNSIVHDPVHTKADGYKVICYFANWAYYRTEGQGQYLPENIDPQLCTHIIYAFASYDVKSGYIKPTDPEVDDGSQFFVRVANMKKQNPKLKVLLAVGGWTDSGDDKYSTLANSPANRRSFAQEAAGFIKYYSMDGISIDWHYPVCWQSDCAKGPKTDKNGFTELLRELKRVFDPLGYVVAASLSGYKEVIDVAYDVPKISELLSIMNIMTYDYHGSWESRTGHLSPLFQGPPAEDLKPTYNSNYTMEYYVSKGADRSKLILGIPFYGQSYSLENQYDSNLGSLAEGPGNPGESTQQPGMLAYYEICKRVKFQGWTSRRDISGSWGPYAYNGNQWVGYDDPEFVKRKARYIRSSNFGGAFVFTLDLDDFNNVCCGGDQPLLRAISYELLNVAPKPMGCSGQPRPTTTTTTTPKPMTMRPVPTIPPSTMPPQQPTGCYYDTRPHPSDCSLYYRCINDMETLQRCPAGLHWNRQAITCDWPSNAGCMNNDNMPPNPIPAGGRPTPGTTESSAIIVTVPHEPDSSNSIDECVNGQYYEGNSCDEYFLCSGGKKKVQMCGPGLHWNNEKKLCDWPSQAKCQHRSDPDTKFEIEACQEGEHSGSTRDCGVYYVCVHGEKVKFRCQGGLHWNNNLKICDWPQNAGCTATSEPDYPTTTTTMRPPQVVTHSTTEGTVPTFPWVSPSTTTTAPTTTTTTTAPTTAATSEPPMASSSTEMTTTTKMTTQRPQVPTMPSPLPSHMPALSGDFMIVCYFTNWAWYRPDMGKYKPEHINKDLCTHIVYGFAVLNRETLTIVPHDSWADIDNRFYEQVAALKNQGKKVTIAIGGWNDSEGDKYSRLVNNPSARRRFVSHVVDFIEKYGFQGLDLDWEYPKCWQVDCDKGPASDKPNFAALVRELSEAFKPRGLLLSSAVSPSKTVIDAGYDVPALSRYFDWISVMTYDFHGQWDKKTGHVAPLYFHEEDDISFFNANYSIHYWIRQGADRRKIVMGMPLYGQSFTLADEKVNGLNSPSIGGGTAGQYTRASGFLSYYEICHNIQRNGWNVVYDATGAMGPYAYKGNQWVSYDDVAMIKKKSDLIRQLDLGGGMVWALDLDDFRNTCGQGEYPLLTTIRKVLGPSRQGSSGIMLPPPPPLHKKEVKKPTIDHKPSSKPVIGGRPVGGGSLKTEEGDACEEPFRPNDEDCSKYYQCLFGKYVSQQCPPGTVWNNDRCDWPGAAGCKPGSPPTQRPMTTTMATTTTTRRTTFQPPMEQFPQDQTTRPPLTYPTTSFPDVIHTSSYKPPRRTTTPVPTKDPEWCKLNWCPTPKPIPPNKHEPVNVPDTGYKVVCYFTNWAWYRPGAGKYKPEDINFNLCTHIAYGFAVLNPSTLLMRPHDGWADIDNQFYKQVTQLRSKGVKVVLALGGWNDSLGDKYSRLVHDPEARRRFVEHAVEFIEQYDFDGLDLDWEYPKCWQVDCEKGPDTDKQGFIALLRELKEAFEPRGLLLSSAVSPNNKVIDLGYDVPAVNHYLDWIAVMTYDFFGQWDGKTGHNAPLYDHPEIENKFFNTNFTINYWIEKGANPKKIVMGMPMYGQSFTLVNASNTGLNSKSSGGSQAGEFTRQKGFLSYYEICNYVQKRGWTVVQDDQHRIGPYAYKGNQWVSFDDIDQIRRKSEYIKKMGLGGGMIWALDLDDFRGSCGCESHPLLKTINRVLRKYPEPDPGCRF